MGYLTRAVIEVPKLFSTIEGFEILDEESHTLGLKKGKNYLEKIEDTAKKGRRI